MDPEELLVQIHQKIIAFRAKKGFGDNEFAENAGLSPTAFINIEEVQKTEKGKIRTIDLLTLLKIFNKYEELKIEVLGYLSGNTDGNKEKSTSDGNDGLLQVYKDAYEHAKSKIAELEARLPKEIDTPKRKKKV